MKNNLKVKRIMKNYSQQNINKVIKWKWKTLINKTNWDKYNKNK